MKTNDIIKVAIISLLVGMIVVLGGFAEKPFDNATTVYQVYLDGKKLGLIADENELYDLINEDQKELREKFGVSKVYPPNGFTISKYVTYDERITSAEAIYNQIKNKKPFTLKGYQITIKDSEDGKNTKQIYVLDYEIFKNALQKVVTAYIDADAFEAYLNDTQEEIIDVGKIIEDMYFDNEIVVNDSNISSDRDIYTNEDDLTKFLLFGTNAEVETYIVEAGDSIDTIAFNHQLNTQEFLIANSQFTNASNLLAVGEKVTIALIHPIIDFVYDLYEIEDVEETAAPKVIEDPNKPVGFREVIPGEPGLRRVAKSIRFVNGEESQEGYIDKDRSILIREPIAEVVTVGTKKAANVITTPVVITGKWAWPTNKPYIISSGYSWRGGSFHNAIDITGTGYGSPIYAAGDGIVIHSGTGGWNGNGGGIHIIIDHQNGYFTQYCHLSGTLVKEGEKVSIGQKIGLMGNTGNVSPRPNKANPTRGTHLHFSVFKGSDLRSSQSINPMSLYNNR